LVGKLFVQGQPEPDRFPSGKVIGCQHLPLDEREVDFALIEPPSVDWGMDQKDTGIDLMQPRLRSCAALRRAVVHDPEPPFAGPLRFLSQHVVDQPAKGFAARRRFTPSPHVPPAHLPRGQILQRAPALVFVLNVGRSARRGREGGMAAEAGLEARLFISTEDGVLGAEGGALPEARIEVQKRPGLRGKVGSTRKDPVLVPPRLEGSGSQNPPPRAPTDRVAQGFAGSGGNVGQGLPTQGLLGFCAQFTGARLDQRVVQRGKTPPCGPVPARLAGESPPWPNGDATVAPNANATAPVPLP
jgi:hypothetical protein